MSFSVVDTRLGKKLEQIKENYPFYFYRPFITSTNIILESNTLSSVISSGILCDISSGNVSVTFPPATVLQSLLNMEPVNYLNFIIVAYSTSFPNSNTVSIIGNTGVEIVGVSAPSISAQETYIATLICISVTPLKFYIM